jgi:thymidylate synthase
VTTVCDRYISADNVSTAWLQAVRMLDAIKGRKVTHLLVRIANPVAEDDRIREEAQRMIDDWNSTHPKRPMEHIDTTRNSLFPVAFARRSSDLEALANMYRARYTKEGLLGFRGNERGTYFGRIVAYPRGDGRDPADQLSETARKLRQELARGSRKSSRYEISIYNERLDRSPMSFPCLAHLSVHMHATALHLQAIYRNEYLVGRAYGNYLGLGELQNYLANAVGLEVGELLVTAGHAELDAGRTAVGAMLSRLDSH